MARIRSIKPEFWASEQVGDCSRDARLLFIGLWNFCDDGGVHKLSLGRIRSEVFPADDDMTSTSIRRLLGELVKNGLVGIFESQEVDYIHILGWSKHQRIEKPTYKHPKAPKNPALYKEWSANDRQPTADLFDDPSTPDVDTDADVEGIGGREESLPPSAPLKIAGAVGDRPAQKLGMGPSLATEAVALGQDVLRILNRNPSEVMHFGQVHAWLQTGIKPDEIKAVAAIVGERMKPDIRDPLKYLARAMTDEIAKLRAGPSPANGSTSIQSSNGPAHRNRYSHFRKTGKWDEIRWGSIDDVPALIRAEVDAEFGGPPSTGAAA